MEILKEAHMKGTILTATEQAYGRYVYRPLRAILSILMFLLLPIGLFAYYEFQYVIDWFHGTFHEEGSYFFCDTCMNIWADSIVYVALFCLILGLVFILMYIFLPFPKRRLRKTIRVGTKIHIFAEKTRQTTYKTHTGTGQVTRTVFFRGGVPVGHVDNVDSDKYKTSSYAVSGDSIKTVTAVRRKGFEIENEIIKYKNLYTATGPKVKFMNLFFSGCTGDFAYIKKMDIITS